MPESELITIAEVAQLLGISRGRAYELVRARVLPAVHLGRQIRVARRQLQRFIDEGGRSLPRQAGIAESEEVPSDSESLGRS